MDTKQYEVAVLKTESKPAAVNFGTLATHMVLGLIYLTGEIVDKAKKQMFYGKEFSQKEFRDQLESLSGIAGDLFSLSKDGMLLSPGDIQDFEDLPDNIATLDLSYINKRLLHVVLGTASETSELADALKLAWEEKRPVDRVNVAEEVGDHLWYLTVAADELRVPLATLFDQNITKLQDKKAGRYRAGSFDVDEAINRDLTAERANLTKSLSSEPAPLKAINTVSAAIAVLREAIQEDSGYAIGWHSNIAQAFVMAGGDYNVAQKGAGRFMEQLFGVNKSGEFQSLAVGGRSLHEISPHAHAGGFISERADAIADKIIDSTKSATLTGLDHVGRGIDHAKDFLKK